jgi:hypothetical protein
VIVTWSAPFSPTALSATAVAICGVKPTNQADLLSVEVPVLPAIGRSSGLIHCLPDPSCTTWVMA